jgi:hypothetical protein
MGLIKITTTEAGGGKNEEKEQEHILPHRLPGLRKSTFRSGSWLFDLF